MASAVAFLPDRFKHAATYYTTGRPYYPPLLSQRVSELVGLERDARILDVGTGSGFLAIDFARHGRSVIALDPSEEMLEVACDNARQAAVKIDFVNASSYDLAPAMGRFKLVTFGRSFHWTNRSETLAVLDSVIEVGGAVVLFRDDLPNVRQNAWQGVFNALLDEHGAADPVRLYRHEAAPHEAILLDSSFDALERLSVLERRFTPLAHFVDRAFSYGKAWQGTTAADRHIVAERIRIALDRYVRSDGTIEEVVEGQALVARRSRDLEF